MKIRNDIIAVYDPDLRQTITIKLILLRRDLNKISSPALTPIPPRKPIKPPLMKGMMSSNPSLKTTYRKPIQVAARVRLSACLYCHKPRLMRGMSGMGNAFAASRDKEVEAFMGFECLVS